MQPSVQVGGAVPQLLLTVQFMTLVHKIVRVAAADTTSSVSRVRVSLRLTSLFITLVLSRRQIGCVEQFPAAKAIFKEAALGTGDLRQPVCECPGWPNGELSADLHGSTSAKSLNLGVPKE